jgi:hypothetical protein
MAYQETVIGLRRDSQYTVEVQLDVGDHPDRCIYKLTAQTWVFDTLPREFKCYAPSERMYSTFSTGRDPGRLIPIVPDHLTIGVNEYEGSSRERVAALFAREYIVAWQ